MNFAEFKQKVENMGKELKEKDIDPVDVEIGHLKASGNNIFVAIKDDTVASYFKW